MSSKQTNIAVMHNLVMPQPQRSYTVRGIIEGTSPSQHFTRTFATYEMMEQWLASHEATRVEITSVS